MFTRGRSTFVSPWFDPSWLTGRKTSLLLFWIAFVQVRLFVIPLPRACCISSTIERFVLRGHRLCNCMRVDPKTMLVVGHRLCDCVRVDPKTMLVVGVGVDYGSVWSNALCRNHECMQLTSCIVIIDDSVFSYGLLPMYMIVKCIMPIVVDML